ncbi:protein bark beetle [Caerostris extrusa]|uniref:Protein bark beetle n=1 Tax=Caerostris extrusa TaxID=172846 RepID=A0AAV4Q7J5_CAEEX|nr:protein bark beetle [Caerostris extrusa]
MNLRYSAFDGVNIYHPDDTFVIEDSIVADNRGHGIFVNSSISQVTLNGVKVRSNGGDGVHYSHHDSYGTAPSFCDTGNIGEEQIYPVRRSHVQKGNSATCKHVNSGKLDRQVLTVNFMGFSSDVADANHASRIDIYDGPTDSSRLLASIPIINNTFPESVTSTRQKILLKYRPRIHYDASFIVEIVANLGIAVYEQKSGILVNASNIVKNGYAAGLHVVTGSGDVVINTTFITGNNGGGVNLTHAGGFVHIDRSSISNNNGRGIAFWFNETSDHTTFNHTVHITRSEVVNNTLYGILMGNQCLADSFWNISLNSFRNSRDSSIFVSPCWSMDKIGHERGVIFVRGLDDDEFSNVPARVEIQYNYFAFNNGKFVANIGVGKETHVQELFFYRNELERNSIREPFPGLNPRSRASAVVVKKHQIVINATYNYWGSVKVREVYERIFDRKDRYNLARVEFLPFLTISSDLDTTAAISDSHERDKIIPFQNGSEIGGEVPGSIFLPRGTYSVTRDIYVRPGNGRLHIEPGAILKFDRSIGMMVQGVLISESDLETQSILYTINDRAYVGQEKSNIRLSKDTEGLLEVHVDGEWGSVCDYGWDIVDASIACNQMGLVLHPEDWSMEQSEFDSTHYGILLSNIQCTLQDTDITHCKSEKDFENSCSSKVGLRCYNPSWSGLRLGMAAGESRLRNIIVEHAGLLDFATNSFKPALQIDFNRHVLEKLKIRNNIDSGVGIMWNEVFVTESRKLTDSHFISNHRHGLVVHTQGLNIYRCEMTNNDGSGIHYNPMFTKQEQRDLISWINLEERNKIIRIPDDITGNISLRSDEYRYFIFTKTKMNKRFSITTSSGRSIGIVVLNSFKETSSENLAFYGRLEITPDAPKWDIRNNLTAFPLRTPGYGVLVDYQPGQVPSGQAIMYIASVDGLRNKPSWETHPKIHIDTVTVKGCNRGISSHHFNRDINDYDDHFHRYSNETILITNTNISDSKAEAMFVWAPFWDPFIKNLAEINYTIINCNIKNNKKDYCTTAEISVIQTTSSTGPLMTQFLNSTKKAVWTSGFLTFGSTTRTSPIPLLCTTVR